MSRDERFEDRVQKILARDQRYTEDAFRFIRDAVAFAHKRKSRKGDPKSVHVSCAELLDGIRRYALQQFGPLAFDVFGRWGIRVTIDLGNIVFLMIEEGVFGASEQDTLEAFKDAYDLHDALVKPFMPTGKKVVVPEIDAG